MSETSEKLIIEKPGETAAGIKSITTSMRRAFSEMGVFSASRALLKLNQKGGIDCQSCAWADPEHRSIAEFCENGAKALADEATKNLATREFFASHSISELAKETDRWLNKQGRITRPMVLRENDSHYQTISWENAFELIAKELKALESPDEAIFYTSGRTSNEAAFLYQLFVRQFGTNNLPDCSNMCHESSGVALTETIGIGKATVRLEDFEKTDLVIVIGQNPGTNAPRMLSSLQDAKRNGAKMIAINPLPEAGLMNFINPNPQHYPNPLAFPIDLLTSNATPLADLHLPVRIGGDLAILKGLMKIIIEKESETNDILDHEFLADFTDGFEEFKNKLGSISWEEILDQSGIDREEIGKAADMFIRADRVITCWAMGITQHKDSVAAIQDIVNLHLLRGQIGKAGAGLCPVRGHSNVQGDRTMGIWEQMTDSFRDNLEKEFNFAPPEKVGFNTVEALEAMYDGRANVFFAMGGNFLKATPDTEYTAKGLKQCSLTVQVITKLNRTAISGGKVSLILPCLGRSEIDIQESGKQFVSTETTTLQVQSSEGILVPKSKHLRSEPWIVGKLAQAVFGNNSTVDWEKMISNYDHIRDSISRVVGGFEDYNRRIRMAGGFYLPNPARHRKFETESGKANFTVSDLPDIKLKTGELMLTTIRSHDQFNTTVYKNDDRYRGIYGSRQVILMNSADIKARELAQGDIVNITSYFDDGKRHAEGFSVVEYPIPEKCAATYFPETNVLVPHGSVADKSNCPTSKLVIITVEKVSDGI